MRTLSLACVAVIALTGCGDRRRPPVEPVGEVDIVRPEPGSRRIPGTRVSLVSPGRFEVDADLPGLRHPLMDASIMVLETDSSFLGAAGRFSDAKLKDRGMTLIKREQTHIGGYQATLYHTAQLENGRVVERWIAVFGDPQASVILYAAYPQDRAPELREAMERAVRSAAWERDRNIDPFEGTRFQLAGAPGLSEAIRMGQLVTFKGVDVPPDAPAGGPLLTAMRGSVPDLRDRRVFAEGRLLEMQTLTRLVPGAWTPLTLDGLEGFEVEVTGESAIKRVPMTAYQAIVFDGPTYYLMQGRVETEYADRYLPAFKHAVRTFERR